VTSLAPVKKPPTWLVGLSLVTVVIVTIPLVYVVLRVSEIPWAEILVVLSRPRVGEITLNTVGLSAAVSFTALIGGVAIGGTCDACSLSRGQGVAPGVGTAAGGALLSCFLRMACDHTGYQRLPAKLVAP